MADLEPVAANTPLFKSQVDFRQTLTIGDPMSWYSRVAGMLLLLGLVSAASRVNAQSLLSGPDLVERSGAEYVYALTLDSAAAVGVTYWKKNLENEQVGLTRTLQSAARHEFRLPATGQYSFRISINGTKTQVFTTPDENGITAASASISAPKIENGNRLTFDVDAANANTVQITATRAGGAVLLAPQTESLRNGRNPVVVDLPCTAGSTVPITLVITVTAVRGEVARSSTPQAVTCPAAPVLPVQFQPVAVVPGLRSVRFVTTFSGAPETVYYRAILRSGRFSMEQSGTCRRDDCRIEVSDLLPGSRYTYSLSASPTANGPWQPYAPGVNGDSLQTVAYPVVVSAPVVAVTGDKDASSAVLRLATDKPSRLQLVFSDSDAGLELTTSPTDSAKEHTVKLPAGLQFFRQDDRVFRSAFRIRVLNASDNALVQTLPVEVVATFEGQKEKKVLSEKAAKATQFFKDYGPAAVDFFKTTVLPAAAVIGL